MKKLSLALAALTFCAAPLFAQTDTIVYGRTTIAFNPTFITTLAPGATVTDLDGRPLLDNTLVLRQTGGAIQLSNGAGEASHAGGLIFSGSGSTIRMQDFQLDDLTPTAATVSALIVGNGAVTSRLQLFRLTPPDSAALPLVVNNGVIQQDGLILTLTPTASQAINAFLHANTTTPNEAAGTASTYSVIAPFNP